MAEWERGKNSSAPQRHKSHEETLELEFEMLTIVMQFERVEDGKTQRLAYENVNGEDPWAEIRRNMKIDLRMMQFFVNFVKWERSLGWEGKNWDFFGDFHDFLVFFNNF